MKTRIAIIVTLMVLSSALVTRRHVDAPLASASFDVEDIYPAAFGDWRRIPISEMVLPAETLSPDDATVAYAAYQNSYGRIVAVVVARGSSRDDALRLHLPESCYAAQGFQIANKSSYELTIADQSIFLVGLEARKTAQNEFVSYVLRANDVYVTRPFDFDYSKLFSSSHRNDDGILVRLSSAGISDSSIKLHKAFFSDFFSALERQQNPILEAPEI